MRDWKILLSKPEQELWGKMLKSLFRKKFLNQALKVHSGGLKSLRWTNDSRVCLLLSEHPQVTLSAQSGEREDWNITF